VAIRLLLCGLFVSITVGCSPDSGDEDADRIPRGPLDFRVPAKNVFNHDGGFDSARQRGKVLWVEFTFAH
jgi:hypothetical protein